MNPLELAFAKATWGAELVLDYSSGEWIVEVANPEFLEMLGLKFIL